MDRVLIAVIILILELCTIASSQAQLVGDVNGDNLVDATDYFNLRDNIFDKNYGLPRSDLNQDKAFNVLDVIMLENYLHREGKKPGSVNSFSIASKAKMSFGRVDQSKGVVEILLKNAEQLGGFEFELTGTKEILEVLTNNSRAQRFKFEINGRSLIALQGKEYPIEKGEGMLIALKISDMELNKLCIAEAVMGTPDGVDLKLGVGKCADELYTKEGYQALKRYVTISSRPILNYDFNEDKALDICDVQAVQNLLYRHGEQPDYKKPLNQKARIKLTYDNVDIVNKTMDIVMQNSIPVAAFQLELTGVGDVKCIGGIQSDTVIEIVTSGNKILGFSNDQSMIGEGKWVLATISFSDVVGVDACIQKPIFVDAAGTPIPGFIRGCYTLMKRVYGCTDKRAINYNPLANSDDGSCAYEKGDPKRKLAKRTWWDKVERRYRSRKYKF